MLELLAEVAWTPTMVGTGIVAAVVIAGKLLPWPKKNGTTAAAQNGEARGEMRARLDGHDKAIERGDHVSEEQWTALNVQGNRLTAIETSTAQTAKDVSEMKGDLKNVLKKRRG